MIFVKIFGQLNCHPDLRVPEPRAETRLGELQLRLRRHLRRQGGQAAALPAGARREAQGRVPQVRPVLLRRQGRLAAATQGVLNELA